MDHGRFKCILSALERYELTFREKQFIETIKKYFNDKGKLTDQQKSILEGIYREKIWIGKTFLGQNNSSPKESSSEVT
jgi:uncharacterized membrane-anchored protein